MIVVETSAMVEYLVGSGTTREAVRATITTEPVAVPHAVDLECVNAIRRLVRAGDRDPSDAYGALVLLRSMPLERYGHTWLLPRIWELRENMWPYDAAFVSLAEALGAPLVTVDSKFEGVPGLRCEVRNLRV